MKQLLVLAGCCFILSALAGCQSANRGVEVIIEGGGEFPELLAGRWKDEKMGWEFVFEPDGTISSAVIDSGLIRVTPSNGIATAPTKDGGRAVYKLGQWTVQYSPADRKLGVEVVVDDFRIDMGPHKLQGRSTDWFVGAVSEDWRTWEAEWFTFPKYIVLMPEPSELPVDPNDNPIDTLIFKKQKETNQSELS